MTDDTTPTPNELLTRIAEASRAGRVEELRDIVNELPVPTPKPSTLRVIDIAQCTLTVDRVGFMRTSRTAEFPAAYMDRIAAQPDPMTLIEQAVDETTQHGDFDYRDRVKVAIRAALEGATQ